MFVIVLAVFLLATSEVNCNNERHAYLEKKTNFRAVGAIQNSVIVPHLKACFTKCLDTRLTYLSSCGGVNYFAGNNTCEICEQFESTSQEAEGWDFWEVTQPIETPPPVCYHPVAFVYPRVDITTGRGANTQGMISKDAKTSSGVSKFYIMSGYSSINSIKEYPNEIDYVNDVNGASTTLPQTCCGSSWLVFGGKLYCQMCSNGKNVMVYDMDSKSQIATISLISVSDGTSSRDGATCSYSWGGYSYIDVAADTTGLYLIWADSGCKISISKIDSRTYAITETWHTDVSKSGKGQAFMLCGRMYLTTSYSASITNVAYIFDFKTRNIDSSGSMAFQNAGYNSHTHYDYKDDVLLAYDNNKQYKVSIAYNAPPNQTCSHATSFTYPRVDLTTSRGCCSQGMISKDALTPAGESMFYFMDGYSSRNTLKVYPNQADYISNTRSITITLSDNCCGASWLVYGGKLYCQMCTDVKSVMVYDLNARTKVHTISLSSVSDGTTTRTAASCSYQWGGGSAVDVEADSTGLYIIWPDSGCLLSISKIDPVTYSILDTWHTDVSKSGKGQAFMICARMYLTSSYSASTTTISHILDFTTRSTDTSNTMAFQNAGYNAHTHYDHRDKVLYAYDSNKQYKVAVNF